MAIAKNLQIEISKDGKSWEPLAGMAMELNASSNEYWDIGAFGEYCKPYYDIEIKVLVGLGGQAAVGKNIAMFQSLESVYIRWRVDSGNPHGYQIRAYHEATDVGMMIPNKDGLRELSYTFRADNIESITWPAATTVWTGDKPKITLVVEDGQEVDITDAVVGWDYATGPDETVLTGTLEVSGTVFFDESDIDYSAIADKAKGGKLSELKPEPKEPLERASLIEIDEEVEDESKE